MNQIRLNLEHLDTEEIQGELGTGTEIEATYDKGRLICPRCETVTQIALFQTDGAAYVVWACPNDECQAMSIIAKVSIEGNSALQRERDRLLVALWRYADTRTFVDYEHFSGVHQFVEDLIGEYTAEELEAAHLRMNMEGGIDEDSGV